MGQHHPACGSGNFLVIAYIRMREIEDEIMRRRGEALTRSAISLTQFYGIEIKSFAAEIARLSLLIAEFQCDVRFIGQAEARALVLPLHATGNIVSANALRIPWEEVCPPATASVAEYDLGGPTGRLSLEDGEAEWETYICGNPPYLGSQWRTAEQQEDMQAVFSPFTKKYKDLDYVAAWYILASAYSSRNRAEFALVATKTICQGIQVAMLWPIIFDMGLSIKFAHRPFTWKNLASYNAGVTCVIVGLAAEFSGGKKLFEDGSIQIVGNIGPYLLPMPDLVIEKSSTALNGLPVMDYGNKPSDGGNLIISPEEARYMQLTAPAVAPFIKKYVGSKEFISSSFRYCLWIKDSDLQAASRIPGIVDRLRRVRHVRETSSGKQSNDNASTPHRFVYCPHQNGIAIVVPRVSSENRPYLPVGFVDENHIIADTAAAIYNAETWLLSIIASRLHHQWIANVCVRLRTDFRYSNTLGWNTFPVPKLTEQNKADLTRCAEDILLAREAHFPATIAELYDPEKMPDDLRAAHDRNDETLERIYIGRRFRNDTERLEKLFDMYTKMTAKKETV